MSEQVGIDANRKDCPFPDLLCTKCGFFKGKPKGVCVWKKKIKPVYKKDRIARELTNDAMKRLFKNLEADSPPFSEKDDEDGLEI